MNSVAYNGKNIIFKTVKSSILKVNQRTETNFQGSAQGGGGSIIGGTSGNIYNGTGSVNGYVTGTIAPINFTYSGGSVTIHEYWLKDEDGIEFTLELLQSNIRAREGNDLSVIYATVEGNSKGYIPIIVFNHGTKMFEILMNGKYFLWERYGEDVIPVYENVFPFLRRGTAIAGVVMAFVHPIFLLLPVGAIVFKLVKSDESKKRVDAFNEEIEKKRSGIDVIFNERIDGLLSENGLRR